MKSRIPSAVPLLVLSVVLAVGAFQWGHARASAEAAGRRRTAVVEAVAHAAPAVVSVEAVLRGGRSRGAGSGVVVHPTGYVVTNSHVIRGAQRITVRPFQHKRRYPARVVADDPAGDLALLRIESTGRWPYISLSPSRDVLLGETAIAIGNPRGLGDSITVGVVSAKNRFTKVRSGTVVRNLIQTDASINTGNSGGPLLNLDGELIGINASILPSASGIAFAIPADAVAALLDRALGNCAPPRNRIPAPTAEPTPRHEPAPVVIRRPEAPAPDEDDVPEMVPLRPSDAGLLIADDGRRLVVRRVAAGSPAARCGVAPGDVLLEVDGYAVEALDDVHIAFSSSRPGRIYDLLVRRGSETLELTLMIPR